MLTVSAERRRTGLEHRALAASPQGICPCLTHSSHLGISDRVGVSVLRRGPCGGRNVGRRVGPGCQSRLCIFE